MFAYKKCNENEKKEDFSVDKFKLTLVDPIHEAITDLMRSMDVNKIQAAKIQDAKINFTKKQINIIKQNFHSVAMCFAKDGLPVSANIVIELIIELQRLKVLLAKRRNSIVIDITQKFVKITKKLCEFFVLQATLKIKTYYFSNVLLRALGERFDTCSMKILLNEYPNPHAYTYKQAQGDTLVFSVITKEEYFRLAPYDLKVEFVDLFLKHGLNINYADFKGQNIILTADQSVIPALVQCVAKFVANGKISLEDLYVFLTALPEPRALFPLWQKCEAYLQGSSQKLILQETKLPSDLVNIISDYEGRVPLNADTDVYFQLRYLWCVFDEFLSAAIEYVLKNVAGAKRAEYVNCFEKSTVQLNKAINYFNIDKKNKYQARISLEGILPQKHAEIALEMKQAYLNLDFWFMCEQIGAAFDPSYFSALVTQWSLFKDHHEWLFAGNEQELKRINYKK